MGAALDRVLVVDVESTCWETHEEQGNKPNEVIEIGICELIVETGEIRNPTSYIVKPRFSEVSQFCTNLTGWTQAEIDEGQDIADALSAVKSDFSLTKYNIWFSCGEYDRVKLGTFGNGSLADIYGFMIGSSIFDQMRHTNIKTLFALKYKLRKELGMAAMLKRAGLKLEGRHHNGADDAYNIAKLVRQVLS